MSDVEWVERFAEQFWDRTTEYGVHPALTEDSLVACEHLLGVKLPSEYVSLLRVQNGGMVVPALRPARSGV